MLRPVDSSGSDEVCLATGTVGVDGRSAIEEAAVAAADASVAAPYGRSFASVLLLALLLALTGGVLSPTSAFAALPVTQCNGTDNGGGRAVECTVTVTNNLDLATGVRSSSLTVVACRGDANAPLTCTTTGPTASDQLITSVTQCNGSGNGGGATVTCTVRIVNNITGVADLTPATVNQCNGSGGGGGTEPTVVCTPIGVTTDATISQCNDSGNGGGGDRRVQCTVSPSTETALLPVMIDQCNGSGNGGGATVTCTASITNNVIAPPAGGTPPDTGPGTPGTGIPGTGIPGAGTPTGTGTPTTGTTGTPGTGTPGTAPPTTGTPRTATPTAAPELPRTGWTTGTLALLALSTITLGAFLMGLGRWPAITRLQRPPVSQQLVRSWS